MHLCLCDDLVCGVQQVVFRVFWTNFGFTKGADENLNQKNLKKNCKRKNENWIRQPKKTRRHGRTVNIDGGFMTRKDHLDWFRVYTDTDVYER